MHAPEAPVTVRLMLAAGVRVDWDETNAAIPLLVRIEDEDGQEVFRIDGQINVGRPPQLLAGSSQLSQMTFALNVPMPRFGGYRVLLLAGSQETQVRRALPFRLAKAPPAPTR